MIAAASLTLASAQGAWAQSSLADQIDRLAAAVNPKVVEWRRDIHAHPELGNREFRTAAKVAEHLRSLGLEVQTEVAHTGVVGLLRGGKPGPVVALRADMDALPVAEQVDLPFASIIRTQYNGQEVGVMHACGHDNHVAILMGVAEVLAGMRDDLPGTVKFIFQPAEEGPPAGENGGARMMMQEGVLENPRPDVIFGLHVMTGRAGEIQYRSGGALAAAGSIHIVVRGRQTHGAMPWGGVDPIVVASQIVTSLQTIVSRQVDLTRAPAIVTIGSIHGGVRGNIIPDSVVMTGTVRVLDPSMEDDLHERIRRTARAVAEAGGAQVDVTVTKGVPVTYNDPALTERMAPVLRWVAGETGARVVPAITGAEDFSFFQEEIPGLFFFLGGTPEGEDPDAAPKNHSPLFFVDEAALPVGVRSLAHLTVDYLEKGMGVGMEGGR